MFSSHDLCEFYDDFHLSLEKIAFVCWFLSLKSCRFHQYSIHRCHGEKGNVVYEMAKGKDLLSSNIPMYKTYNFVRSNGEVIPAKVSERITKLAMSILDRDDHREEKMAYHGSLGNYFAQK